MAFGYKWVGNGCVPCMTHEEALDLALTYAKYSDRRYKVFGNALNHYLGRHLGSIRLYCYDVLQITGENLGDQRINRKARTDR